MNHLISTCLDKGDMRKKETQNLTPQFSSKIHLQSIQLKSSLQFEHPEPTQHLCNSLKMCVARPFKFQNSIFIALQYLLKKSRVYIVQIFELFYNSFFRIFPNRVALCRPMNGFRVISIFYLFSFIFYILCLFYS